MENEEHIQQMRVTVQRMADQIDRLVSDAESEKETRRRRNDRTDARLEKLERWQAQWAGAIIAISIIGSILSITAILLNVLKH